MSLECFGIFQPISAEIAKKLGIALQPGEVLLHIPGDEPTRKHGLAILETTALQASSFEICRFSGAQTIAGEDLAYFVTISAKGNAVAAAPVLAASDHTTDEQPPQPVVSVDPEAWQTALTAALKEIETKQTTEDGSKLYWFQQWLTQLLKTNQNALDSLDQTERDALLTQLCQQITRTMQRYFSADWQLKVETVGDDGREKNLVFSRPSSAPGSNKIHHIPFKLLATPWEEVPSPFFRQPQLASSQQPPITPPLPGSPAAQTSAGFKHAIEQFNQHLSLLCIFRRSAVRKILNERLEQLLQTEVAEAELEEAAGMPRGEEVEQLKRVINKILDTPMTLDEQGNWKLKLKLKLSTGDASKESKQDLDLDIPMQADPTFPMEAGGLEALAISCAETIFRSVCQQAGVRPVGALAQPITATRSLAARRGQQPTELQSIIQGGSPWSGASPTRLGGASPPKFPRVPSSFTPPTRQYCQKAKGGGFDCIQAKGAPRASPSGNGSSFFGGSPPKTRTKAKKGLNPLQERAQAEGRDGRKNKGDDTAPPQAGPQLARTT